MIGLYWLAHWRRFQYIERVDGRLLALNLLLLGAIAIIPFPTAVIGEHGDTRAAVAMYAIVISLAGIIGPVSWLYAWRAGLTTPGLSRRFAYSAAFRGFAVPIVMLGSLPVLFTTGSSIFTTFLWLLIIPVQGLIRLRLRSVGDD